MTMSFLEKLKHLHGSGGPPAPPRRIETSPGNGWSEDEFDEEDGDTYEAPPCERPAMKVPAKHVEENVYLGCPDRTSQPPVSQRQAVPPPRPVKNTSKPKPKSPTDRDEFYFDPWERRQPPEVIRKDKKLATRQSPPAIPNQDDDVYLDPNEGQDTREPPLDVYVEPMTARPPIPSSAVRVLHPHPPIMKPPVPPIKTNSLVINNSMRAAIPIDGKSYTFPFKVPPPMPNNRPPLPMGLKESKPCPPPPPLADSAGSLTSPGAQEAGLRDKEWFAGICTRKTAEEVLLKFNKDGSFMVRRSTAQNAQQPFTLVVLLNQKVYNIPVRFIHDSSSYALGKEGKKTEELFSSLQEMISHHKDNPLLLIDSKSQAKHTTYLTYPVHP